MVRVVPTTMLFACTMVVCLISEPNSVPTAAYVFKSAVNVSIYLETRKLSGEKKCIDVMQHKKLSEFAGKLLRRFLKTPTVSGEILKSFPRFSSW